MKVKDLIKKLEKYDEAGFGDLEVYGYCDHAQSPEKISGPAIIYTSKTSHTLWEDEYTMDKENADYEGYYEKAILL